MGNWSSRYLTLSAVNPLKPVYVLMVLEDWTYARPSDAALEDAWGRTETSLQMASDYVFDIEAGQDLIIYDVDGWEMIRADAWTSGTQNAGTVSRALYGTAARAFDRGAVVGKPLTTFSTKAISGTDWRFRVGMGFPSGGRQEIDMREGRTRWDEITIPVIDMTGDMHKLFKSRALTGMRAVLMGGYEGMAFQDFSFLHVGTITSWELDGSKSYTLTVDSVLSRLKKELFGDVEEFSTTLSALMNSSQLTAQLTSTANAYLNTGEQGMADAGGWGGTTQRCGIYFKIGSEWMANIGLDSGTTMGVTRGRWDTTAASHSNGATVDMAFGFEGHPVDFLLGLLLTRHTDSDSLSYRKPDGTYYYDWRTVVDVDQSPLAIGVDFGDVEVSTFHDIRDRWFTDYVLRYKIMRSQDMESFIPKHILKPFGMALYANRAGRLALMIQQPPLAGDSVLQLTKDDIIGMPRQTSDAEAVVNVAVVEFDHDGSDFTDSVTVLDATSQAAYDREDDVILEVLGLDSNLRGEDIAARVGRRKIRPLKDPNPTVTLAVHMTYSRIEIGQIIQVTHPDIPDLYNGTMGWDKYVLVTGKKPGFDDGVLELDVVDTGYYGKRYGLIAPSATVDYDAASDEIKAVYAFVADGTSEKMSDSTAAYQII